MLLSQVLFVFGVYEVFLNFSLGYMYCSHLFSEELQNSLNEVVPGDTKEPTGCDALEQEGAYLSSDGE